MEQRISNQERDVETINGVTYDVRIINGVRRRIARVEEAPVNAPRLLTSIAPSVPDVDPYVAAAEQAALLERAERGAALQVIRAQEEAGRISSTLQRTRDELDILAFRKVQELERAQAAAEEQRLIREHNQRSGTAFTMGDIAKVNQRLRAAAEGHVEDDAVSLPVQTPAMPEKQPTVGRLSDAFGIDQIGIKKEQSASDEEDGDSNVADKKLWYKNRKTLFALGAVGVVATTAAVSMFSANMGGKQAEAHVDKSVVTMSPQEKAAIAKKQNPDITPASIALGQCLTDANSSPLFSGHASGAGAEAWVYKAINGTPMAAQTPDGKFLPYTVQTAPFDAAACAPVNTRGAMVTIKGDAITIDKSKVTPQLRMTPGGTPTPTVVKFGAAPTNGLSAEGATALNAAQVNADNKNNAATIAYATLARAVTLKDSTDLGRVEAQMDNDLIQSVNDQISAFYKKQGRDAPTFTLAFTGNYLAPQVIDPAALPDILTKTKNIVRMIPLQLTALDFNAAATSPATSPTPTGK